MNMWYSPKKCGLIVSMFAYLARKEQRLKQDALKGCGAPKQRRLAKKGTCCLLSRAATIPAYASQAGAPRGDWINTHPVFDFFSRPMHFDTNKQQAADTFSDRDVDVITLPVEQ